MDTTLRASIGSIRSSTGEKLTQAQVNQRLIARIEELEEAEFRMIGALQCLGVDCCDRCKLWLHDAKIIRAGDRCRCVNCVDSFDDFYDEEDDQETADQITKDLLRYVRTHTDKCPRNRKSGQLLEPWLSQHKRNTQ